MHACAEDASLKKLGALVEEGRGWGKVTCRAARGFSLT